MQAQDMSERATIVGFFSDAWDAQAALEDLNFAGFAQRLRYIQNDHHPQNDSTKDKPSASGFFARLYGFDNEDEYLDSRGNITVNPEAEEYFTEAFERKNHIILVQTDHDMERVIEILRTHHGKVETQNFAYFQSIASQDQRVLPSETRGPSSNYHQTSAIEPPLESPRP